MKYFTKKIQSPNSKNRCSGTWESLEQEACQLRRRGSFRLRIRRLCARISGGACLNDNELYIEVSLSQKVCLDTFWTLFEFVSVLDFFNR